MQRRKFLATTGAASLAQAVGSGRLERAVRILDGVTASGAVSASSLYVSHRGQVFRKAFGAARSPDTVFLLASITKPMTAAAVMTLVDKGELSLHDPVRKFLPDFKGGQRGIVTIRHLLTHTSGLPDMLPENEDLRRRHAPLSEFVKGTCVTPLLFQPGTQVKYQSMGILLAATIAERITGKPFREFLRQTVFTPLRMAQSSLGLGGRKIEETALCQVTGDVGWNWNSPYWRDLGAPWGGAHSTAAEVGRFLEYFLAPHSRLLRPQTAASMIVNQTSGLNEPRGIGFMVKPGSFGKSCSANSFGHYGSTGTIAWADPKSQLVCVLLTTKPASESRDSVLGPVSDAVAESAL
ncbi:MAG: beta-lactamase family protein [Acidobacteriia bacterium]|nr:beta-lactamase family protein [Terriglobia bacterium]